jgi:hypothetical protein
VNRQNLTGILPGPRHRALLVGQTGSGKTTLAKYLLTSYTYTLALDPKITLGTTEGGPPDDYLDGFTLCRTPEALIEGATHADRLQYRPDPEYQKLEYWDQVYRWAFDRRNTLIYTDEVNLVCHGYHPTDGMRACVTSGRERGIGMIHASQRPAGIPGILLSESEHKYVFRLEKREDRRRLAEADMPEQVIDRPAEPFWFWYRGPGRALQYLKLNL